MEQTTTTNKQRLRDLLTKRPFVRVKPYGHYDHGERYTEIQEEAVTPDTLHHMIVTQEDFLRELDPCGHLINDREYYPDVWRQNPEDNMWYKEEVPRYAFAFQYVILQKQLTHLVGNDIQFELADKRDDDDSRHTYNAFKRGWADKNMETAWYQLAKSVKATGDGAFVAYLDKGKFGWNVFTFLKGDRLYPHYDSMTGRLDVFARTYSNYNERGKETTRYVEVWDDTFYYRYTSDIPATDGDSNALQRIVHAVKNLFSVEGYTLETQQPHGFNRIPVAYQRDDNGACWSYSQEAIDNYEFAFSRLAQSNHDFGLPIMYVKGEGSEEVTEKDMTHASKIFVLPTDGEIGFVNKQDASNAYKAELETLEKQIFTQSFVVKPPELKSGDMPGVAVKLLYSPAYEKAMTDAQEFDTCVDDMVDIFMWGYGIESEMRLKFENTPISHFIKPYIHLNETELTTNLSVAVQNGFISKQTAAEKGPHSTPQEWDRICREQKEEQMQELLLSEQKLEIQTDISLRQQEEMLRIQAEHDERIAQQQSATSTASDGGDEGSENNKPHRRTSKAGGSVATGRGTGSPAEGNYNKPGYDRFGNKVDPETGKANKWKEWNQRH